MRLVLYWTEMVKLSREDVLKLARLSRLHLSEDEIAQFADEISAIFGYVDHLQEVDLSAVAPTNQVTGLKNVMRQDKERDYGADAAALLKNAPAVEDGHIKVKRMLSS